MEGKPQTLEVQSRSKAESELVGVRYAPQIRLEIDSPKFKVKVAETLSELHAVLKLRHRIFYEELAGKPSIFGLDLDSHDFESDHMIIIDKKQNQIVGCYRLKSSQFTKRFYSLGEFTIQDFLSSVTAPVIELGRACLHPQFRNGIVMHYLWQGVAEYIKKTGTEYLFGCSTVMTTNYERIISTYQYLKREGFLVDELGIRPHNTNNFDFPGAPAMENLDERVGGLPPLLEFYLRIGAKLYGPPAYDDLFGCFDFFTILDLRKMPAKFSQRFGLSYGSV